MAAFWAAVVLFALTGRGNSGVAYGRGLCPARCQCDDESLQASCATAALEVVPIQLNPELLHLNLSCNRIASVHYTLSFYANLRTLDLSFNRIQSLGAMNFESQRYLRALNLSNNMVTTLSKDVFKGLSHLEILDLSLNKIVNIAEGALNELRAVREVCLKGNELVGIGGALGGASLEIVDLSDNQILEVPRLTVHPALRELRLSRNLVQQVDALSLIGLHSLQRLYLDTNVVSDIELTAFDDLPTLHFLDLSDNNLTKVPTQQLSKLSNLTTLSLSGNWMSVIPALAFRSLFELHALWLSRLPILKYIDARAFVDNVALERVWLDANPSLQVLPARLFHGNTKLAHVSLRECALLTLEPANLPLDQLNSLRLSGTKIVCNCSLAWLWRLVNSPSPSPTPNGSATWQLDASNLRCGEPPELFNIALSEAPLSCTSVWPPSALAVLCALLLLIVTAALASAACVRWRAHMSSSPTVATPARLEHIRTPPDKPVATTHAHAHAHDYRALPLWDTSFQDYGGPQTSTPYINKKPHVVYV